MKILHPQEPGSRRPGAQSAGLLGTSPAHLPSGTRPAAATSVKELLSRYFHTMPQCLRKEPAGGCPGIPQSFVPWGLFLTQLPFNREIYNPPPHHPSAFCPQLSKDWEPRRTSAGKRNQGTSFNSHPTYPIPKWLSLLNNRTFRSLHQIYPVIREKARKNTPALA